MTGSPPEHLGEAPRAFPSDGPSLAPRPTEHTESPDETGGLLFDLTPIDLAACAVDRAGIERIIPHRGAMSLLDRMVWHTADYTRGVAAKHVRLDEFWVPGHFPGNPIMPGVLQVEAGAQTACWLYNIRFPEPKTIAFLRIEDCRFRSMVVPGDTLFLLCNQIRCTRRMFSSEVQGVVNGRVTYQARITGMSLPTKP